jgi:mannose-6-phosphate isomerase-like protein (cupin superfamily)
MNLYIDIDNTICIVNDLDANKYVNAIPIMERINHFNELYDKGYSITYWTARGGHSGINYEKLTTNQLKEWGCKYHQLKFNKPSFDLMIDDKCCNSEEYCKNIKYNFQQKRKATIVNKGWGHEVIFVNNNKYCGKILHFKKDAKFSMHYHLIKQETWYISSGKFIFKYINTSDATIVSQELEAGDVITNEIGQPHQLICIEEGDVFEVSTEHYDTDSYRVFKGDSQSL